MKISLQSKSILSKLWITMLLLVIIVLGSVWLFQIVFLDKFYVNNQINKLVIESRKITHSLKNADIDSFQNNPIILQLTTLSQNYNISLQLLNTDGTMLYSVGNTNNKGMFMMQHFDMHAILQGKEFISKTTHPRLGIPVLLIGQPIKNNNKVVGVLQFITPLTPIQETTKVLKNQLSIISIIALFFTSLIAFILSRNFTKPILEIDAATKKISEGDYSINLTIKSEDELGKLAKSINELSQQLSKIDCLRKEFIANVSHELKTPLGIIKGYAELIEDTLDKDELEKQKQNIYIILDESNRLDTMVKDILFLSQIEAGFEKLYISEFDINFTIEELINKISIISKQHVTNILFTNKSNSSKTYGDKEKILRVLLNLLTNAIYHSKPNSKIEILTENVHNKLKVTVKDFGEGISEKDLPYIWDRFYKVDKSRKRDSSGTGLGMAIVKNILTLHHSEYGIQSSLGQGTLVWFTLNTK